MADVQEQPASGTPGTEQPAGGTPSATAGVQGQPTQQPSDASRTGAAPTGQPRQEDRSNWLPPHRLREETEKRRELEQRLTAFETQIAERDRKIAALAGVNPQDPDEQKAEQVRNAFFQMFPNMKRLADLTDEQIEALARVPDFVEQSSRQEMEGWSRHGDSQLSIVSEKIAQAYGMETLDADQQQDLRDSLARWLRTKASREIESGDYSPQNPPPTIRRYERGDAKLLDEFVTDHTKRWVEPARRTVTAQTTNRIRPTVNSSGRAQVTSVSRPEKFKSLDERIDFALNVAKERGAQFSR